MDFSGYNAPSRVECDVYDLVIEGNLPQEINGTWYQSVPDPQYPPMLGHDTFISGDGMVRMLRFENGHVDLKQRYVQSERWKNERKARRSLYGLYRNPYTDDPSVRGKGRGAYNTTPIFHGGRLLALKEDNRGMQIDPDTLETLGECDFNGKLRSQTMTAHTRPDHETGELYFFGYEASGLASRDVAFCVADKNGALTREEWFQVPYCALMHDFALTKEHVIFPGFLTQRIWRASKRAVRTGSSSPTRTALSASCRAKGRYSDMRWFRGPARSGVSLHECVHRGQSCAPRFRLPAKPARFPSSAKLSNIQHPPEEMAGNLVRWTFDLSKPGEKWDETILDPGGDMRRVADKDALVDYDVGYYRDLRSYRSDRRSSQVRWARASTPSCVSS